MPTLPNIKPQWFQILLALADRDLHGLAIMKEVLQQTDGQMRLWPARLYGALQSMNDAGLIEEIESPAPGSDTDRRRFFSITDAGREALTVEVVRLQGYVDAAQRKSIAVRAERG